ncbi:WD40-repeat-containing domain protein, partial [Pisolithus croceorrhizus]
GTDGIKLWNIKSRKELTCANHESYGAISCATWIKTKHSSTETLCYGTGMGYLVFMRSNPVDNHFQEITARRLGTGLEITCVAWDASWIDAGARIAIGMRDNVIQVLLLNSNSQLQSIFAGRLEHTVPKSVAFTQRGNIYIFGLYDGNVVKMNAADGVILSEHCYDSVIGCAAVSLKKELIVIDNATNGFTLYSLDREDPIQYFVTEPQSVPVPKQVAFGEESKIIVGGSDNGSVYLFERRTGRMLEKLAHSKTGLVQTITVRPEIFAFCLP